MQYTYVHIPLGAGVGDGHPLSLPIRKVSLKLSLFEEFHVHMYISLIFDHSIIHFFCLHILNVMNIP